MKKQTRIIYGLIALFIIAGVLLAFRPKPALVETAAITSGALQETVDEEGKTHMHDHFVLAATVAGKLRRVELHAGDPVRAGQVVTWIDPAPIEPRQTAVLQARLDAARASQREADALVGRAKAENDQANIDLERTRKLFEQGISSKESLDHATSLSASNAEQLQAARSRSQSAAHQVEEALAALVTQTGDRATRPVAITSPASGRILRLIEQSERVVTQGAPLVEIGYTPRLEVVADFLTRDAVKVNPGMDAIIDDWGGDHPLRARVRMVEPGAFTKISALGVEEQRANIILDFLDGSDNLADAYRVEVKIIIWQSEKILKVPSSAVFRSGEDWAAFTVVNGVARRTVVKLGHRGAFEIEVLQGLNAGDSVIVHPSSEIKDSVRVQKH
ncbi:MAG: HlyD family efflux transporter periplasmic adaptor subunit [Acidobacteriia bacterium]|nr:HlyD family efflux transporter periplasmic adaptor subunit [Terriglobia bacterium]